MKMHTVELQLSESIGTGFNFKKIKISDNWNLSEKGLF